MTRRIKVTGKYAGYHVLTRTNHREYRLDDHMKSFFIDTLKQLKHTYFCDVISYTILDSHYHIELMFEHRKNVDPDQAVYRWNRYHRKKYRKNRTVQKHRSQVVEALTDISHFMKKLNSLLTREYNRRTGHVGTLWERRYRSSIVERGRAMLMTAAYIELNSFRASLTAVPEEYRYSSLYELKKGNRSGVLATEVLSKALNIEGYREHEAIRDTQRGKTTKAKRAYSRYIEELYKRYIRYVYRQGSKAPKRKLIRGQTDGIKVTAQMREKLEKKLGYDPVTGPEGAGPADDQEELRGSLQKGAGLCSRKPHFIRGRVMGSRRFAETFYADHVAPDYNPKEKRGSSKRHRAKWLHSMAGGVWGVFNGSRSRAEEVRGGSGSGNGTDNEKNKDNTGNGNDNHGTAGGRPPDW